MIKKFKKNPTYPKTICPSYMKMSENINEMMKHLKFCYISILTNLLQTDNETKSVKTIYK